MHVMSSVMSVLVHCASPLLYRSYLTSYNLVGGNRWVPQSGKRVGDYASTMGGRRWVPMALPHWGG